MADNTSEKKKSGFRPGKVFGLIILALVVYASFSSFYMIDETEQAVITRFGKYTDTVKTPGIHLKLPFGIDKNQNVAVTTIYTEEFGFKTVKAGRNNEYKNNITEESIILTGDLNLIDAEWEIRYQIEDPKLWLFSVYEKEETIRDISRSVINTLIGDTAILDVIGSERKNIQDAAIVMMNENFNKLQMGVKVISVTFQNTVAPEGVQEAFEDVNKAMQDMNRYINEGKELYNTEIYRVEGEAEREIQIAEGYKADRINRAKGDVARFNAVYEEYKRAPRVTKERIYLETMEELFGGEVKPELIDSDLKNILPIKELNGGKN
ncbi:MAG: FtsH protease activity modulator HflK [Treponema sp.]|nr:FtsH protease activity modulator HflK [Treponema sp.]